MKRFLFAMCLIGCSPANVQATTEAPHQVVLEKPRYTDLEVRCAQETITSLYRHSEQYGNDIFIFHIKSSDAWNGYLSCILQETKP